MQNSRTRPPLRTPLRLLSRLIVVAIGVLLSAANLASGSERITPVVRAVQEVGPSVVNIQGQKSVSETAEGLPAAPREVNGMGTGVVIDPRGYILTNFHVVDGVRRINVTLSTGQSYLGQLIARDTETDLAIIRIQTPHMLPVVRIGTSEDLMPGESVVAVGNAYGYENTVTTGIISALHRNVQVNETQQYLDLIQTDASINPGNSGGPLLNIDGEMIGVNVAVRAGAQGIGFAIPVDKALEVAARMLSIEKIDNHWHGVTALHIDGPRGPVTIARVDQNSPAQQCGLKRGDQLQRIGTLEIEHPIDVERALLGQRSGKRIPVVVRRNDELVETDLVLASRSRGRNRPEPDSVANSTMHAAWESLGMRLVAEPQRSFRELKVPYEGGMRVVAVRPGSSAEEQGVREGDILVRVHRWATTSEEDVRFIVDRAQALARAGNVKFFIVRGSETFYGQMAVAPSPRSIR